MQIKLPHGVNECVCVCVQVCCNGLMSHPGCIPVSYVMLLRFVTDRTKIHSDPNHNKAITEEECRNEYSHRSRQRYNSVCELLFVHYKSQY